MRINTQIENLENREKTFNLIKVYNRENKSTITVRIDDKTVLLFKENTPQKEIDRRVNKFKNARENASKINITR